MMFNVQLHKIKLNNIVLYTFSHVASIIFYLLYMSKKYFIAFK